MLLLNSNQNRFENFPDEILLLIYRYLSSSDVLYSFYGLNQRLSQTISGYYHHVVIGQVPYKQFSAICSTILPSIGSNICSLVLSNQWKGILSKLFLDYYEKQQINFVFPNLKEITCISFSDSSLKYFLNSLKNFRYLYQIKCRYTYEYPSNSIASECLLNDLFTTNNNQLKSILFDDESIIFSLRNFDLNQIYTNIEELSIDLQTTNDLHKILTILPQLNSLTVGINKNLLTENLLTLTEPVNHLKIFRLQSFGPLWTFNDLNSILKRMTNLEELSMSLETSDDIQFLEQEKLLSLISHFPLKIFDYFLRFYYSKRSIDLEKIISNWKDFRQEIHCFQNETKKTLILYSLPFTFSYLILPIAIIQNEQFQNHMTSQVKILTLINRTTDFNDTFNVVKKCRNLENLHLRITENITSKWSKEIQLKKLPYLTKLTSLSDSTLTADYFEKLFEISPNLQHLEVNYEFIKELLYNETLCNLFQKRIISIYLLITKSTDIDLFVSSFDQFISIFIFLKHFYISLEQQFDPPDLILLLIFKYLSQLNSLISIGIVGIDLGQYQRENLLEWIQTNSILNQQRSFQVNYTDKTFRLWL